MIQNTPFLKIAGCSFHITPLYLLIIFAAGFLMNSNWTTLKLSTTKILSALVVVGLFTLASGCGPEEFDKGPTGSISGKITHNGKALPKGTSIQFTTEDGKNDAAVIGEDGAFSKDDIPVGKYKVYFTPPEANPDVGAEVAAPTSKASFPEKYLDAENSGLTVEIKEGETKEFNQDLK